MLTLDAVGSGRLVAMLSDGRWGCDIAEAAWPPAAATGLPPATVQALGRVGGGGLRLQLKTALDAWPWEAELAAAVGGERLFPRYLTDLPEPEDAAGPPAPLVVTAAADHAHLALVQAARRHQRPLVLADRAFSAAQRLALERGLRSLWRDPLLLSQALALALVQLGLAPSCCRLYGDGRAQLVDTEQGWRPVTALSIDLVGSTSLLQSLGAEAYAQRLQAYHERCRDVIVRFHGSLDAPQGDDGLMAYFGFPTAVEDAAAHALTAAWQLSRGLDELGLQARMGVASGQVAVSAQQAFGPEVHLAARLCAAARPGQILVAPSTHERVGAGFVLEPCAENLLLKDFGSLAAVHSLSGLRPSAPGAALEPGAASRFVGRRDELAWLREAWSAACTGQLRLCRVHGEAGIGKSRLLQEFARQLRAEGRACLELSGQAQAVSSPFAAVVDALRRHWAVDADIDATQLRQRLLDRLPSPWRDDGDVDELARLLVLSRSAQAAPALAGPRRWNELLLDCLQALAQAGPFCLLADDAHWLDPSSIELLRRLRQACATRPLLIVLGERSEPGLAATLPDATTLEMQGLGMVEAQEMARTLGAGLSEQTRQRVIDRAEGIPLYLEESLRMLSRRDAAAGSDVPAKLEDLLMVRLDELGPDRALAQLISVLGRECSAAHLDALLALDDPFVARARQQGSLDALLHTGLLQAADGPLPGYRFKHVLVRDAAYGSIWTHDRRRLHGLCADLIERSAPEPWQQRPEQLAQHLEAAGRPEQARRAWLAAAQLAASRHAHQESLELAQRALALHEQLGDDAERARSAMLLHLLQASAQIALRGYGSTEVETAYLSAERAGSRLADTAQALRARLGLEACYVMRGDLGRAAELAQAAVAATHWDQDARLALQAHWALANVRFHQGDWRAALAGFDECLAHYRPALHRPSGVQDPAIMCLGYSSWIHFELGQADEALHRIDRIVALAEELQHPFSTAVALGFAASIKRLCGDSEGAWPHALEAVRIGQRGGFQVWLAHAWMVSGQLRCDRGDLAGGNEDMDRGYGLWLGSGARISCATYLTTRAEIQLRQGQTERAAAGLQQALQISQQIGEHYYQAEALRLQGLCAWQAGDRPGAQALLQRALALADAQHKPGLALRCALSLGALQAAQGRCASAAQGLRSIVAELPQHGRCRDTRWAHQALACWQAGAQFAAGEHTPWEPR